jgi:hypothetical protein
MELCFHAPHMSSLVVVHQSELCLYNVVIQLCMLQSHVPEKIVVKIFVIAQSVQTYIVVEEHCFMWCKYPSSVPAQLCILT